jgi:uncharacterized protein (DUF58 family)
MQAQETGVSSFFAIPIMQFFVGALLLIALLNGQRDLIVLTLLVLGVMVGARLWTQRSLVGLQHHSRIDKLKVFPGEKLTLKVTVENAKLLPIWLQINLPAKGLLPPSSGETALTKEGSLLWYQRIHFDWDFIADRRGVYQVGPLYLQAGDLFAFFSRQKKAEEFHSILVYPRLIALRSFPLPRLDFFGVPRAKNPIQDPIYILGTRDYQHGQPAKYVHWKASARHNRLQEKVFESTHQEKILLVVDVGQFVRHQAEEDFERALEAVASLAVRLDQQGHALGLIANGCLVGRGPAIVPIARNDQQMPAILELLARLQMKHNGDIIEVLRHRLTFSWGASCVHFAYTQDETVHSVKKYLKRRRIPAMFFVCQRHGLSERDRFDFRREIYHLDDIRIREAGHEGTR